MFEKKRVKYFVLSTVSVFENSRDYAARRTRVKIYVNVFFFVSFSLN